MVKIYLSELQIEGGGVKSFNPSWQKSSVRQNLLILPNRLTFIETLSFTTFLKFHGTKSRKTGNCFLFWVRTIYAMLFQPWPQKFRLQFSEKTCFVYSFHKTKTAFSNYQTFVLTSICHAFFWQHNYYFKRCLQNLTHFWCF